MEEEKINKAFAALGIIFTTFAGSALLCGGPANEIISAQSQETSADTSPPLNGDIRYSSGTHPDTLQINLPEMINPDDLNYDGDQDFVPDIKEPALGLNPLKIDTDGNGIIDYAEYLPRHWETKNDGSLTWDGTITPIDENYWGGSHSVITYHNSFDAAIVKICIESLNTPRMTPAIQKELIDKEIPETAQALTELINRGWLFVYTDAGGKISMNESSLLIEYLGVAGLPLETKIKKGWIPIVWNPGDPIDAKILAAAIQSQGHGIPDFGISQFSQDFVDWINTTNTNSDDFDQWM